MSSPDKLHFLKISTAPVDREEAKVRTFSAVANFVDALPPLEQADCLEDLALLIDNRIAALGALATRSNN